MSSFGRRLKTKTEEKQLACFDADLMCHLLYVFYEKEHENVIREINELGINNILFQKQFFNISYLSTLFN